MLLKELFLNLHEAELEVLPIEQYWDQHETEADEFIPSTIYLIKELDGRNTGKYQVYIEAQGKRRGPDLISKYQLDNNFIPVRPNQKPDAEGFVLYQSAKIVEAVKHSGPPMKLQNGSITQVIKKNDYVVKQFDKNKFSFSIEKPSFFENSFSKKQ